MILTIAPVVLILAALAVAAVCVCPMALWHLSWWADARAFYLVNIRAEDARWKELAEERRRRNVAAFHREQQGGPVAVEEAA